jgi:hypothetical protein
MLHAGSQQIRSKPNGMSELLPMSQAALKNQLVKYPIHDGATTERGSAILFHSRLLHYASAHQRKERPRWSVDVRFGAISLADEVSIPEPAWKCSCVCNATHNILYVFPLRCLCQ